MSLGIFWVGFGFNEDFKTELERLFWFKEKPTGLIFGKCAGLVVFFHNLQK